MDATRLIGATRTALAQARAVQDIVGEAWQTQALAGAIGSHLAVHGPFEARAAAGGLSEAGARASGALRQTPRAGAIRAAHLSEVRDPWVALAGLCGLLGEVGIALVGVACSSDEDALYWQCMEAIDAADETSDRVRWLQRRLALREREGGAA
ncbi:DUF6099 family protein [Streptomyces sp. HU2014]|uniref:Uncharacterized protein n=1 Tax=Streptomyces albireticuli TaxID=1940 RepID=A0A1Z2KZ19_9ACTN|nr:MULTISPECIES: DUF6099 family protein [Streptomyces]ARZ67298.1 hypothetical protein SMD11_1637 [Streptomyces albireticuli]UQI47347.1 DUF6099 family protein [Streptomyces sp. HU2014]